MAAPKLPKYFSLNVEQVRQLRRDAELKRDLAVIHYVPDVHDLAHFCFPINARTARTVDMPEIADEQLALMEIFVRRSIRPILVQEYERELFRNYHSLKDLADAGYAKAEMLRDLLQNVDVVSPRMLRRELVTSLEKDFNLIVATLAGIYSMGLQRWEEVVNGRLLSESAFVGSIDSQVIAAFRSYAPSGLVDDVKTMLIKKSLDRPLPRTRRFLAERAADTDARVVDKVIQVNRYLESAYAAGHLSQRHLVVYFASAERTADIFSLDSVRRALPVINGETYVPWRNTTQIFLSMILRPSSFVERSKDQYSALISNLSKFEQIISNVSRPSYQQRRYLKCNHCILDGGHGRDCALAGLCNLIANLSGEYLKADATALPNLALLAGVKRYSRFASRRPSEKLGENVKRVQELVDSLLQDREVRDISLERIWLKQQSMLLNSVLLQAAPPDLSEEVVTSAMQVLPFAVQIESEEYRDIVRNLMDYYQEPFDNADQRRAILTRVYAAFVSLDRSITRFDPQHELVRLLMYLTFETTERTGRSLERIDNAADRLEAEGRDSSWAVEFAYIRVWALRLHHRYEECDMFGREWLGRYPHDPRLVHGLLLNAYSWYEKNGDDSNYRVPDLIRYAEQMRDLYCEARELYHRSLSTAELVNGLIGVSFNDLAYLNCFEDPPYDLHAANDYLEQLALYVPRSQWEYKFPEYLQTEATVLYCEAEATRSLSKLEEAAAKLTIATRHRTAARFRDLQERIDSLRAELTKRG